MRQRARLAAEVFRALGHPVRLEIVEVLRNEGEACVCHLEHRLGLRQAYLSQQLSRLRDAGLVTDRREGLNVFYGLTSGLIEDVLRAGNRLEAVVGGAPDGEPRRAPQPEGSPCTCPRCLERRARNDASTRTAVGESPS